MTPERWETVSDILNVALSLDTKERHQYLETACAGDEELRQEVESLIASHQQAGSQFLNIPATEAPAVAHGTSQRLGRRAGPYLLQELIGHGGMGEVFAAIRADGQYEKRVAVKLVRSGYDGSFILDRFRNERQILASLVHPNIAQLLDGGTTEDGVPYLVMELVEGVPIDTYCDQHHLNVTERLNLFRQICSAVQYAHQHLVIHRDLKPGNIFVTQDGTPKLLDFGIAKIVGESGSTEATAFRPMTPEFASPEQFRGDPITTASDVYSLGVVLYQLLTRQSPYGLKTSSTHELAQAITDTEPEAPSLVVQRIGTESSSSASQLPEGSPARLNRRLKGDLDFILLKALRKEPRHRYGTVEQFAEDIRRHLEGLPVYARKGTWTYHAAKFVRRHRAGVIAASLISISLIAGVVATVHEARIAEANRRRAEKRFNDVRKLANSLMFEVHDSIRDLPGATAARKLIIERAQQYLDSLADESHPDPSLLRELATAYGKLAQVEGDALDANLGESSQAVKNCRKAVDLMSACVALEPGSALNQRELAAAYMNLSMALVRTGDKSGSKDFAHKAVQLLEDSARAHPNASEVQSLLGEAYERAGTIAADENDLPRALEYYEKSLATLQEAGETNARNQSLVSSAHKHIGSVLAVQSQLDKALEHYRAALAIDEAMLAKDPENVQARYNITYSYSDTGWILNRKGDTAGALQHYGKALAIRQALVAADPQDVRAQRGLAKTYNYIGVIYRDQHDYAAAIDNLQKALEIRTSLAKKDPSNDHYPYEVADSWAQIGFVYSDLAVRPHISPSEKSKQCRQAVAWMRKSLPVFQQRKAEGKLTGTEVNMPNILMREIDKCEFALGHHGQQ